MINPTLEELIEKEIIEKIEGIDRLKAICQKCKKSWLMRFNRVPVECAHCKAQKWWNEPEKRGPKKS